MIETFFKKATFSSLFRKNRDGSVTPRENVTILGIAGNFTPHDKIQNLKLIDGSDIHAHSQETLRVRKLGDMFMIMGFS